MVNQKKKLNNHKVFKLYKNNFTTTLIDTQQCDSKYICGGEKVIFLELFLCYSP